MLISKLIKIPGIHKNIDTEHVKCHLSYSIPPGYLSNNFVTAEMNSQITDRHNILAYKDLC